MGKIQLIISEGDLSSDIAGALATMLALNGKCQEDIIITVPEREAVRILMHFPIPVLPHMLTYVDRKRQVGVIPERYLPTTKRRKNYNTRRY